MSEFHYIENEASFVSDDNFFDKIAKVAHNCYQVASKDHQSNVEFVMRLIKSKHLAMIEHERFCFKVPEMLYFEVEKIHSPYIVLVRDEENYYLSLSLRTILESEADSPVKELIPALDEEIKGRICPDAEKSDEIEIVSPESIADKIGRECYDKIKFVTYHMITDRGVTHELVRHRPCSFAQESTRYCNYTKDKFQNSLSFMKPLRYEEFKEIYDDYFQKVTDSYFALIQAGARPDEARSVLPNALKASIMVSATIEEWKHIFDLRMDPHAHEDIRRVTSLVREDMVKRGFIHE